MIDVFIGIDVVVSIGIVIEFKGEVIFLVCFCWGGVYDDFKMGIGVFV